MPAGVEILSQTHIVASGEIFLWLAGISLILAALCIIIGIAGDLEFLVIGFVGCLFAAGMCFSAYRICDNYIDYKVIISDEVNFNEIIDTYELIGQEGKIYILREYIEEK